MSKVWKGRSISPDLVARCTSETDLQSNLLANVGWSGGEVPDDLCFVVELVGKNPIKKRWCNSPQTIPTGEQFKWGGNR